MHSKKLVTTNYFSRAMLRGEPPMDSMGTRLMKQSGWRTERQPKKSIEANDATKDNGGPGMAAG